MKTLKFLLKSLVFLLVMIMVLFGVFLLYATISDYNPDEQITLYESDAPDTLDCEMVREALTWNIGYAGLGDNMDFFYDGGTRVRDSKIRTRENLSQIQNILRQFDTISFILLQEVDQKSKRSYKFDQTKALYEQLDYPFHFYALNYKSFFVPIPPLNPMGKVRSGLLSFSKYEPARVDRFDFPGSYPWPTKLFMLDRCFMVMRFIMKDGNELLVINTHNSAFDGGVLKTEEMAHLKEFILNEYEQGHYILVGGDWNQNPPGYADPGFNEESGYRNFVLATIEDDFPAPGWKWLFDRDHPTNRALIKPYDHNTATTILDFFLVSPNIQVAHSKTLNLNFQNSDHQPVFMQFALSSE